MTIPRYMATNVMVLCVMPWNWRKLINMLPRYPIYIQIYFKSNIKQLIIYKIAGNILENNKHLFSLNIKLVKMHLGSICKFRLF